MNLLNTPMKLAPQIRDKISMMPKGKTFGYRDLDISREQYVTVAKTLERLQQAGIIKKASKGFFYKPEQTVFGELKPSEEDILQLYLFIVMQVEIIHHIIIMNLLKPLIGYIQAGTIIHYVMQILIKLIKTTFIILKKHLIINLKFNTTVPHNQIQ